MTSLHIPWKLCYGSPYAYMSTSPIHIRPGLVTVVGGLGYSQIRDGSREGAQT